MNNEILEIMEIIHKHTDRIPLRVMHDIAVAINSRKPLKPMEGTGRAELCRWIDENYGTAYARFHSKALSELIVEEFEVTPEFALLTIEWYLDHPARMFW